MKHTVTFASLFSIAVVGALAGCGGKSKAAVGNAAGGAGAALLPVGIHACHFIVGGEPYGEHRCDVTAGDPVRLDKVSGMEAFGGTLAPMGTGLHLTAGMGCGPMVTVCDQQFSVMLEKTDGGWSGAVVPKDTTAPWWLAGSTFVIDDATGYGGATYGDAWPEPDGE